MKKGVTIMKNEYMKPNVVVLSFETLEAMANPTIGGEEYNPSVPWEN